MHKVKYYFRKPFQGYFSIEELFSAIGSHLPPPFEAEFSYARHYSKGLFRRIRILLEASRRQGDINHITGDIHFIALLLKKRRTILTVHDCVTLVRPSGPARAVLKYFWFTMPTRRCAYVTVISEKTRRELLGHVDISPSKIVVIPNCVAPEFRPGAPKRYEKGNIRVLQIGTKENKNLIRICRALSNIPCTLEVVGQLSDAQRETLKECGIRYEVSCNLSRDELVARYQAADIVAFASTYEGFGMPVVEAQATGTALLTSNLSPMKEVAGEGACLVDPFSIDDIRRGLKLLVEDEHYREGVILDGLENVKRYRIETVAEQYAALYRKVLDETGRS